MVQLTDYLMECDAHFYREYALPLIKTNPKLFDLDGFESRTSSNSTFHTMMEAFHQFENDKKAQYEMHPKYGRYVWDIADQWYQKWNVVFSVEHMCNWTHHGATTQFIEQPFDAALSQPWFDHVTERYCIHPDHRRLLQEICQYIIKWNQSNRPLALSGAFKLNTIPFFSPSWFANKQKQNRHSHQGLAPSYLAKFVPPYQLTEKDIPNRWNHVFLKGLSIVPNHQFAMDPIMIASVVPILGLTVHYDEEIGYSRLMLVMKKAAFGNLERHIETEIPANYIKPCQLALSVSKDIKDLHWRYIHGNIHPRNILLNYADYVGELVDVTFMQRSNSNQHMPWAGRWPYVAPEVIATGLSTAADIYAFGIILWQLISRVTFPDYVLVDPVVYRIEPIPGVLKEWEDLYIECLHTDPKRRPSAYVIYRRLTQLLKDQQQSPTPLSDDTIQYMKSRQTEIDEFLQSGSYSNSSSHGEDYNSNSNSNSNSTESSESLQSPSPHIQQQEQLHSNNNNTHCNNNNLLVKVGDHVLTNSVTRPSYDLFQSYPSLIQSFPPYL